MSATRTILLLEDDRQLGRTIQKFLEHSGYTVYWAYDGEEAQDLLYEKPVDLMLLDVKVPCQNGFNLLSERRRDGDQTPAIFITSLHTVEDLTRGYDAGCDDYIRKPFALKELHLRIEALLKKQFRTHANTVQIDPDIQFDIQTYQLTIGDKSVPLKTKEAKLLAYFLTHPNTILSHETLSGVLWDYDEAPSSASLRTYIHTLRRHLGKARIETIKHSGYRYVS